MVDQIIDLLEAAMPGPQGPMGPQGPQGLPGVNALPADEAVAAYLTDRGSVAHAAWADMQSAVEIVFAAADSSEASKKRANVVCTGSHDEQTIQRVLDETKNQTVRLLFLPGTYQLDAFDDGVMPACLRIPDTGTKRTVTLEGTGYPVRGATGTYKQVGTAVFHVTQDAFDALDPATRAAVITLHAKSQTADTRITSSYPSLFVRFSCFGVDIPDNVHAVTCVDCFQATGYDWDHLSVGVDKQRTELVPESVTNCNGYRTANANHYGVFTTIRGCIAFGFRTGFNCGGEHLLMENCGALWCAWPYRFHDGEMSGGHPFTILNCFGENCLYGFRIGANGVGGSILDYNMEVLRGSNTGHSPYAQRRMNEETPGGRFRGPVSYQISDGGRSDYASSNDLPFWEPGTSGVNAATTNLNLPKRGMLLYDGVPDSENSGHTHKDLGIGGWIPRYTWAWAKNPSLATYAWVEGGVKALEGSEDGFGAPMWFNGVTWMTPNGRLALIGKNTCEVTSATLTEGFPVEARSQGGFRLVIPKGTYAYRAIHIKDGVKLTAGRYKICHLGLDSRTRLNILLDDGTLWQSILPGMETEITVNLSRDVTVNVIVMLNGTVSEEYALAGAVSINPIHTWTQPVL